MQGRKKTLQRSAANLTFILVLFALLVALQTSGTLNAHVTGIIATIGINIILAVSLNVTTGYLGQLVLGHAGFMSVGAYASAFLTQSLSPQLPVVASLPIGLLAGGVLAALIGLLIGIPALRLRGDYLAIITLGFGEIIRVIIQNLKIVNNGNFVFNSLTGLAKFNYTFVIAILCIFATVLLVRSRHGRAIIAIREDEIAAEAAGISTTYYKTLAFVFAAFFAGIAGGLYAHHLGVLKAADFNFNRSVEIVIFVVLGGMGSTTGSIIAASSLTILPELLRVLLGDHAANYRMLVYSLALILIMIFKPSGLFGQYEFSLYRALQKMGLFFKEKKQRESAGEWHERP